jgi:hypothetical protein
MSRSTQLSPRVEFIEAGYEMGEAIDCSIYAHHTKEQDDAAAAPPLRVEREGLTIKYVMYNHLSQRPLGR